MAKQDPRSPFPALVPRVRAFPGNTDEWFCDLDEVLKLEELVERGRRLSLYALCDQGGGFAPVGDCNCLTCRYTREFDTAYEGHFPQAPAVASQA